LKSITKEEVIQIIDQLIKHSLSIYVVAKCHEEQYKKIPAHLISDFKTVKTTNTYYDDYCRQPLEEVDFSHSGPIGTAIFQKATE
jgi:hypothetical protein